MNLWEPNDFRNMKWSPAVKTPQISVLLVENHFIDDDFIAVPCLGKDVLPGVCAPKSGSGADG